MAVDTEKSLRNQVLYSVYVRNYSEEGTFAAVQRDLDRIHALGTDIIWLLPIHPTGEQHRKGTLGSPYAIRDYRAVNPEFGTLDDFRHLVDAIHDRGMKCIIDVVYNHTSPDSWLAENHPEWFFHKPDGSLGNRFGDWWDVADLDYSHPALWDYQIETLKYWARLVDGFRCDVAPLVPLDFWKRAREEVAAIRPGCIWLCESVERAFIVHGRADGFPVLSDAELYQAFDAAYDYDVYPYFRSYLEGRISLAEYTGRLDAQEWMYPDNYVKLRFLENHDRARAAHILPDEQMRRNWTAFLYFQRGLTLLYAGQEVDAPHVPSLFDKDPVNWNTGRDQTAFLQRLAAIKRDPIFASGSYTLTALPQDVLLAVYEQDGRRVAGLFSLRGRPALVTFPAPNGVYQNLIDGSLVEIFENQLSTGGSPIVLGLQA